MSASANSSSITHRRTCKIHMLFSIQWQFCAPKPYFVHNMMPESVVSGRNLFSVSIWKQFINTYNKRLMSANDWIYKQSKQKTRIERRTIRVEGGHSANVIIMLYGPLARVHTSPLKMELLCEAKQHANAEILDGCQPNQTVPNQPFFNLAVQSTTWTWGNFNRYSFRLWRIRREIKEQTIT